MHCVFEMRPDGILKQWRSPERRSPRADQVINWGQPLGGADLSLDLTGSQCSNAGNQAAGSRETVRKGFGTKIAKHSAVQWLGNRDRILVAEFSLIAIISKEAMECP